MNEHSEYLTKLNTTLLEMIKREWPQNWPNWISEVVQVSKQSESVCANNMKLLRLLSEEAFENVGDLTHNSQLNLQKNLHKEFGQVFELCMFILDNTGNDYLLSETFKTFKTFLKNQWMPKNLVFESGMSQLFNVQILFFFCCFEYSVFNFQICFFLSPKNVHLFFFNEFCFQKLVQIFHALTKKKHNKK